MKYKVSRSEVFKIIDNYTITSIGVWFQVWHKDYSTMRLSALSLDACEYYISMQKFINN